MKNGLKTMLLIFAVSSTFHSCDFLNSLIHDDKVVARIGKQKLYISELSEVIPSGVSAQDSVSMALQYINNWASEILFSQVAATQLSKSEQNVSVELEDYKRSLLKYRYEQRYINERLDTVISHNQVEQYYNSHKELFILEVPIVKGRFLDIMQESPNLEVIKAKMSSEDYSDLSQADSLAYSSALKYSDTSDKWVDMVTFARGFGEDYGTLLSRMDRQGFIEIPDERGDVKIAYICEMQKAGTLAPLEYCEDRIRDIIISNRRHALLTELEQDLLKDAQKKNKLVIY